MHHLQRLSREALPPHFPILATYEMTKNAIHQEPSFYLILVHNKSGEMNIQVNFFLNIVHILITRSLHFLFSKVRKEGLRNILSNILRNILCCPASRPPFAVIQVRKWLRERLVHREIPTMIDRQRQTERQIDREGGKRLRRSKQVQSEMRSEIKYNQEKEPEKVGARLIIDRGSLSYDKNCRWN